MQTVTDPEDITVYAPHEERPLAADDPAEEWYDEEWIEEETMPYPRHDRRWQVLRLILLLMLLVAAAAFVVFVLLPTLEIWLNPDPMPQLQPPVQV